MDTNSLLLKSYSHTQDNNDAETHKYSLVLEIEGYNCMNISCIHIRLSFMRALDPLLPLKMKLHKFAIMKIVALEIVILLL